jgi:hypothetical protein
MAATTANPLLGFARATGMLLLIPVGFVALLGLITAAFEAAYYVQGRPADAASMAARRNIDLAASAGSIDAMTAALGPPAGNANAPTVRNELDYWWWRDSAVRAGVVDRTPITIDIGQLQRMHLLPYRRPDFPGSFLGLRIGDPAPGPAQAVRLKVDAQTCCNGGGELSWDVKGGRVTAIHFSRPHYLVPTGYAGDGD